MTSRLLALISLSSTLLFTANAQADDVYLPFSGKTVRLQNYSGNGVAIWYAGTSCMAGGLSSELLSSSDKSRLYATVMAARIANVNMFVYYENSSGTCKITSFGME